MLKGLLKGGVILISLVFFGCDKDRNFQEMDRTDLFLPTGFAIDTLNRDHSPYQAFRKDSALTFSSFQMAIYSKDMKLYECRHVRDTNAVACAWKGRYNGEYVEQGQYFCRIRYRLRGKDKQYKAETHFEVVYE